MNGTYPGRIVLVEGDEVDVDLQIAAEKIRLATPFAEIGLWDRAAIRFEATATGGYELTVADDVVTFYPADTAAFAEAIEEMLDASGMDEPVPESRISPVSLVPSLPRIESDNRDVDDAPEVDAWPEVDETPQTADISEVEHGAVGEPVSNASPIVEQEPSEEADTVSRFGPSSRERLAAAMSGFRQRQAEADDTEEATPDQAEDTSSRPSSGGFVIPGHAGYGTEADDVDLIEFDEELSQDTVADQVIESSRSLRGATSLSLDKAKLKKAGIGAAVVAVVVALGFAVPVVIGFFSGSDDTTPATVPQATVPVTQAQVTTPVTEATAPEPTVTAPPLAFDITSEAFVERWNEAAAQVSPNLRFRSSLPSGAFEVGFTQYIAMIGDSRPSDAGSEISTFTLEIDPTGPSGSDRLGIQALGLAIAVADPSLEPNERGAVLGEMGLNVRNPELGGLNGATVRNGVDYRLVFDSEAVVLRLTLSPQG